MANMMETSGPGGPATKAREGAEQIRDKALERVEDVREKATAAKDKLSERVRRVGSALHSAGDDLRQEDEVIARYADRVSERFEQAAQYVRTADPKQAIRDAENFARREPAIFFGGAFLLGLAAARFLKSSQRQASSQRWEEPLNTDLPEVSHG